jgi:sugar O-acyltransferase (sialic acid O-acetyltransferase NeuD family)
LALIILGGGGHARVVLAAVGEATVARVVTPDLVPGDRLDGTEILGGDEVLAFHPGPTHAAIGDNARRREVVGHVGARTWQSIVSPHALILGPVEIGEGAFIGARAVVQPGARIGRHAIVNTGAIVEHDGVVGDFAHIAPGAVLSGGVRVGDDTLIGAGAVVTPGISIGRDAVIGAGAVVVRDVPDGVTVVGNPARPLER